MPCFLSITKRAHQSVFYFDNKKNLLDYSGKIDLRINNGYLSICLSIKIKVVLVR